MASSSSVAPDPTAEAASPLGGDDAPKPFPKSPSEFDTDARISYSKLDEKYILESEAGEEYEYDSGLRRWVPVVDDALAEQQAAAYKVEGVDELEPAVAVGKKKRKHVYTNGEAENGKATSKKPKPSAPERKNTAVYVTNLPPDVDVEEVRHVFSKCGVIAEEIDTKQPRIKLYTDDQDIFKGDALVVYFRAESVSLAVQMLDETDFRFGEGGRSGKMRVQAADFSYKAQKEAPGTEGGGKKRNMKEMKKVIKKTQKLNSKLADWDDDDISTVQDTTSRWDRVVILKRMFSMTELEDDPAALLDIKEDIREECAKLGTVTNVVLYDREPDGVASVRFSTPAAAQACVKLMNGRFFGGAAILAHIATGNEKFRKSGGEDEGEAGEELERLDKFGSWLEGDKAVEEEKTGGDQKEQEKMER